jgi:signal transduction histidine kinase
VRLRTALKRLDTALRVRVHSARQHVRGVRAHVSRSVIGLLLVVVLILVVFQMWAHVALSRRAVETSDALTHRHIAHIFAERLRRFSERSDRAEVYRQINELARLNPAIRLYLLDHNGIVKASPKGYGRVALPFVDLRPVKRFLALKEKKDVVYGDDPLKLRALRPISVEPLRLGGGSHYLYVVLGEGGVDASLDASIGSTVGMGTLLVTTASIILVVLLVTALAYTRLQRLQGAIAALSHDLRSPLSSIQGYLETLLQKGESLDKASSQRFMNVALRSTRSASTLVDDLHHLSKLEASGDKPEMESFSLADLLMDVGMSAQPQAKEKKIDLSVHVPPVLPLAYGNLQLIERLVRNLLQNGLRYTPERGKVECTAQMVGGRIRVTVSDSGCGIPEAEIDKVKSPFFRAKNIKASVQGSGIGLSIASAVAHIHGSDLKILSREGQGTAVIFELAQAPLSRQASKNGFKRRSSSS